MLEIKYQIVMSSGKYQHFKPSQKVVIHVGIIFDVA